MGGVPLDAEKAKQLILSAQQIIEKLKGQLPSELNWSTFDFGPCKAADKARTGGGSISHPPAPSCLDSLFSKRGTLRFLRAENAAREKARPWAKRLSWQTQGRRVK